MPDPIRVVLVEDHQIVREGLKALLEGREDVTVVAEADNGKQGVALVEQHRPDVAVMDPSSTGSKRPRPSAGRCPRPRS